jgi:uncharacterized SAM-binding protein YcdF (DUF218 family)
MSGRRRRLLRGCLVLLALAALLAAGAFLSWKWLLAGAASWLVVSEEPVAADLVVVHAGDPERVAWGAELVSRGLAPRLLLFLDPRYQRGFFGLSPEEALERTRQALEGLGVPRDRVVIVRSVYSTWDEGRHAVGFLGAHPEVERILVVSSPFHMRRVRSVWAHALEARPDPPDLVFVPVPWDRTGLSLDCWWTREEELIWVQNEYVKLVLYHLRYF